MAVEQAVHTLQPLRFELLRKAGGCLLEQPLVEICLQFLQRFDAAVAALEFNLLNNKQVFEDIA